MAFNPLDVRRMKIVLRVSRVAKDERVFKTGRGVDVKEWESGGEGVDFTRNTADVISSTNSAPTLRDPVVQKQINNLHGVEYDRW